MSRENMGLLAVPAKRKSPEVSGPLDYPRRRAVMACEVCRSRKSKCDGNKPKCRLCSELGATCVYREPSVKLDAGDKLILERLDRIEKLLQRQRTPSLSAPTSSSTIVHPAPPSLPQSQVPPALPPLFPATPAHPTTTPLSTIPKLYTNGTLHFLTIRTLRILFRIPPPPSSLLSLELTRPPLHTLTKTPCVDLSNTPAYTAAFFTSVNPWYAIVNPFTWPAHYRTALSNGFREGPESCVVLLVLALGQAATEGNGVGTAGVQGEAVRGMQYFTAAWSLMPSILTLNTVVAAQCQVLAAAYLFYLVRPLEAWNLLCSASTKLQLLLISPHLLSPADRELLERIYWNTLLFESDLLAEMDLPHSGITAHEKSVGLPRGFTLDETASGPGPGPGPPVDDSLWYFLAQIALRRLLNRVLQTLYATNIPPSFSLSSSSSLPPLNPTSSPTTTTTTTTSTHQIPRTLKSLAPIVSELNFQLTQWHDALPASLKFPLGPHAATSDVQTVLKLRFYACRTIIYRPYVLGILEDTEEDCRDPIVHENARKGLEAAVRQLEDISMHHSGHMAYLWQGALSIVSQTLLIMAATINPILRDILSTIIPELSAVHRMIHEAVSEVERLGSLSPSLAMTANMLREADINRRAKLEMLPS